MAALIFPEERKGRWRGAFSHLEPPVCVGVTRKSYFAGALLINLFAHGEAVSDVSAAVLSTAGPGSPRAAPQAVAGAGLPSQRVPPSPPAQEGNKKGDGDQGAKWMLETGSSPASPGPPALAAP